jgi:hypothetical protein
MCNSLLYELYLSIDKSYGVQKGYRVVPNPAPCPSNQRRPVPADLVGRCCNCLRPDHVAAACPNTARCLRYHHEGHHAQVCQC